MSINFYQVDAFTDQLFKGNPAGVCPLENRLNEQTMQNIAMENNLSETAFFTGGNGEYNIRWFTPQTEVNLCGHATLGSAHVIFNHIGFKGKEIVFHSKSGTLWVTKQDEVLYLNFPAEKTSEVKEIPGKLLKSLKETPVEVHKAEKYLVVFNNERTIRNLNPDFMLMKELEAFGVIVTAPGDNCDFVSRFFAPRVGINEDPVTGSAHTYLIPYWSRKLGKKKMAAQQLSKRGGSIICEDKGERVLIGGKAVTYLTGEIPI
jgi:PhzF family phenazine biosynthesis protein